MERRVAPVLALLLAILPACGRAAHVSLVVPPDQAARVHVEGEHPRIRIASDSPEPLTARLVPRDDPGTAETIALGLDTRTLAGSTTIRIDNETGRTARVDVYVTRYRGLEIDGAKPRSQMEQTP